LLRNQIAWTGLSAQIWVRNVKPKDAPYSLADEKRLSLVLQPTGAKWW